MKKVVGYTDAWSVTPGETINVMVSTYGVDRFRADLVRVICGDDEPTHDIYREQSVEAPFSGEYPGREQPIEVGSYVLIESSPVLDALESFTVQSWIWPTMPGVLELRRSEDGIRYRDEEPSEYYLEFTGEYGGLWRRLGSSPQSLVGVGTVAVGFDVSGYYRRTQASFDDRVQFIFEGIGADEVIGDFGFAGGGASGSEIDAVDTILGTPSHALVVASSEGHSANTYLVPDETGFHHCAMDGAQNPDIRADMTFFETPGGGAVFSVGSIAWGASLPHNGFDNNVARISENVLRRFLDDAPFPGPDCGGGL